MSAKSNSKKPNYPFPAGKSMSQVMERIRRPNWDMPVTIAMIEKLGIASGNRAKPVTALRFLGVIDNKGEPTQKMQELQSNYAATMRTITYEKYSELLAIYSPEEITRTKLETYFGGPAQVNERRARFFAWLCKEAGIDLPNLAYREETEKMKKKKIQKSSGIPKGE